MTVDIPVKRVHSRQRRFIAPGAVWDLLIGVEVIGSDYEFRYDNVLHYRMDYLFGGFAALQNAIASAAAAADASASAGKRRKRRLVFILNTVEPRYSGYFAHFSKCRTFSPILIFAPNPKI